jgi:hypothetical protein
MLATEVEVGERLQAPADFFADSGTMWASSFECTWRCRFSDDGLFDDVVEINVLTNVLHCGSGRMCSDSDWQALASLEAFLPRTTCSRPAKAADESGDGVVELVPEAWMHYPAMWEFLTEIVEQKVKRRRNGKTPPDTADRDGLGPRMGGDEAVEELIRRRAELGDDPGEEWRTFFCWKLRGGRWTGENKGVAFDCYAAYALKGTSAETFVSNYAKLRMSGSWSIRLYGDREALVLARAWIHRNFHFLKLWMEGGSRDDHVFSAADVLAYVELPELVALSAEAEGPLAERIVQLRSLQPM